MYVSFRGHCREDYYFTIKRMYLSDGVSCVNMWVGIANALELCRMKKDMPPLHYESITEKIKAIPFATQQALLGNVQSCRMAKAFTGVAQLAKQRGERPALSALGDEEKLRKTLMSALNVLSAEEEELCRALEAGHCTEDHHVRLLTALKNIEGGNELLHLSLLCDCMHTVLLDNTSSPVSSACSIQASRGIWKKKHTYGNIHCNTDIVVYSSSAYRASWTLISCLGLAILLILLGY